MKPEDHYSWLVSLPGLTQAGANRIVAAHQDDTEVIGPEALDPQYWFAQHWDPSAVRFLCQIFRAALSTDQLSPEERFGANDLLDEMLEWLVWSNTANDPP